MSSWRTRLFLLLIIGLTTLSVITVWPSEPDRYLPDAIPWPEGKGIKLKLPTIEGGTFRMSTIKRRAMSLGLDLRGGTRLVLAPEEGVQVDDLDAALDGAQDVIERRVNEFGVAESEVNRLGDDRLSVQLPGIEPDEAVQKIGRTALLQFCEPVTNSAGDVATTDGEVQYRAQTCDPVRDANGEIIVTGGTITFAPWAPDRDEAGSQNNPGPDEIVWQPASAVIDGQTKTLDGNYLRPNTFVRFDDFGRPTLIFQFTGDGADIAGQVTDRLVERNYPLAPYLDGEPIVDSNGIPIAPRVQGQITTDGVITGLSPDEAQDLSRLLNTGAFPIPLRVIQQQDVDATLGETAVRDSVIAGEVALLLIMAFMILYYRVPGVMASLALVVYTSFVLAIFKLWPVTLTLSGVAAFVLSVGMAVDANILIFERMKEELRVGRNIVAALEDGFARAWSSIRDSNISTLITCAILYWFGNQFGESAIKGFAITLAIGVLVSMFSAITVTRTFMQVVISIRPLARRLWLFAPDLPEDVRRVQRRAPAVAGGSGSGPKGER
jgi:preprotein translocase subunit SecD